MSQKQYLRRVRRALTADRATRAAILRDLQEIFASAAEHGQSEAEVIDRLGPPVDFARAAEEQLGVDRPRRLRRRMLLCTLPAAALSVLFLALFGLFRSFPPHSSVGVIGGADGPTAIFVTSAPISPAALVPLLCAVLFAAVALLSLLHYFRQKRR